MYSRFAGAVIMIVLIASAGVHLEKRNFELRRSIGLQHYRLDVLQRRHALHRLKVQQLGAPARLIESLESGDLQVRLDLPPVHEVVAEWPAVKHPHTRN